MDIKTYVETVLQPKIQGDGGWIEYVSFQNDELTVIFRGECSKCLIVERCISWIESEILRDKGESVKIVAQKKKPFFWDK